MHVLTVALLSGIMWSYGKWGSGVEFFPEDIPPRTVFVSAIADKPMNSAAKRGHSRMLIASNRTYAGLPSPLP